MERKLKMKMTVLMKMNIPTAGVTVFGFMEMSKEGSGRTVGNVPHCTAGVFVSVFPRHEEIRPGQHRR